MQSRFDRANSRALARRLLIAEQGRSAVSVGVAPFSPGGSIGSSLDVTWASGAAFNLPGDVNRTGGGQQDGCGTATFTGVHSVAAAAAATLSTDRAAAAGGVRSPPLRFQKPVPVHAVPAAAMDEQAEFSASRPPPSAHTLRGYNVSNVSNVNTTSMRPSDVASTGSVTESHSPGLQINGFYSGGPYFAPGYSSSGLSTPPLIPGGPSSRSSTGIETLASSPRRSPVTGEFVHSQKYGHLGRKHAEDQHLQKDYNLQSLQGQEVQEGESAITVMTRRSVSSVASAVRKGQGAAAAAAGGAVQRVPGASADTAGGEERYMLLCVHRTPLVVFGLLCRSVSRCHTVLTSLAWRRLIGLWVTALSERLSRSETDLETWQSKAEERLKAIDARTFERDGELRRKREQLDAEAAAAVIREAVLVSREESLKDKDAAMEQRGEDVAEAEEVRKDELRRQNDAVAKREAAVAEQMSWAQRQEFAATEAQQNADTSRIQAQESLKEASRLEKEAKAELTEAKEKADAARSQEMQLAEDRKRVEHLASSMSDRESRLSSQEAINAETEKAWLVQAQAALDSAAMRREKLASEKESVMLKILDEKERQLMLRALEADTVETARRDIEQLERSAVESQLEGFQRLLEQVSLEQEKASAVGKEAEAARKVAAAHAKTFEASLADCLWCKEEVEAIKTRLTLDKEKLRIDQNALSAAREQLSERQRKMDAESESIKSIAANTVSECEGRRKDIAARQAQLNADLAEAGLRRAADEQRMTDKESELSQLMESMKRDKEAQAASRVSLKAAQDVFAADQVLLSEDTKARQTRLSELTDTADSKEACLAKEVMAFEKDIAVRSASLADNLRAGNLEVARMRAELESQAADVARRDRAVAGLELRFGNVNDAEITLKSLLAGVYEEQKRAQQWLLDLDHDHITFKLESTNTRAELDHLKALWQARLDTTDRAFAELVSRTNGVALSEENVRIRTCEVALREDMSLRADAELVERINQLHAAIQRKEESLSMRTADKEKWFADMEARLRARLEELEASQAGLAHDSMGLKVALEEAQAREEAARKQSQENVLAMSRLASEYMRKDDLLAVQVAEMEVRFTQRDQRLMVCEQAAVDREAVLAEQLASVHTRSVDLDMRDREQKAHAAENNVHAKRLGERDTELKAVQEHLDEQSKSAVSKLNELALEQQKAAAVFNQMESARESVRAQSSDLEQALAACLRSQEDVEALKVALQKELDRAGRELAAVEKERTAVLKHQVELKHQADELKDEDSEIKNFRRDRRASIADAKTKYQDAMLREHDEFKAKQKAALAQLESQRIDLFAKEELFDAQTQEAVSMRVAEAASLAEHSKAISKEEKRLADEAAEMVRLQQLSHEEADAAAHYLAVEKAALAGKEEELCARESNLLASKDAMRKAEDDASARIQVMLSDKMSFEKERQVLQRNEKALKTWLLISLASALTRLTLASAWAKLQNPAHKAPKIVSMKPLKGMFRPMGMGNEVPKHLRWNKAIRDRKLTKHEIFTQVKELVEERRKQRHAGSAEADGVSFSEFLYYYLHRKYGVPTLVMEWSYNLQYAIDRFLWDPTLQIFANVLDETIPEEAFDTHMDMTKMLQSKLKEADKKVHRSTLSKMGLLPITIVRIVVEETVKDIQWADSKAFMTALDNDFETLRAHAKGRAQNGAGDVSVEELRAKKSVSKVLVKGKPGSEQVQYSEFMAFTSDNFQAETTKQLLAWYKEGPSKDSGRRRSIARGGWHETVVGQPVANLPPTVQRRLLQTIQKTDLFHLTETHLETLVKTMTTANFKAGDVIIKQDDEASNFIIVETGRCDVHVRSQNDPEEGIGPNVASKGPDEFFGEVSLLYNCRRTATIIAHTDVSAFLLDRDNFRGLLLQQSLIEKYRLEDLVESVSMFHEVLTKYDKVSLARNGEEVMYDDGDSVVIANNKLEQVYIVDSGFVVSRRPSDGDEPSDGDDIVDTLGKGEVIGQRCYQLGWPLTHNYFAQGACRILVITYEQLEPVKHKLKTHGRLQRKRDVLVARNSTLHDANLGTSSSDLQVATFSESDDIGLALPSDGGGGAGALALSGTDDSGTEPLEVRAWDLPM